MYGQNAGHNRPAHGKAWWGKRPLAWYEVSHKSKTNKCFKRLLHKIERREGRNIAKEELA